MGHDGNDDGTCEEFQGKIACPACAAIYGKAHEGCIRCGGSGLRFVEDELSDEMEPSLGNILQQMRQKFRPN
ncbi:MAG: hypothetical protein AAFU41_15735 [Pseudomonadota bacterium]